MYVHMPHFYEKWLLEENLLDQENYVSSGSLFLLQLLSLIIKINTELPKNELQCVHRYEAIKNNYVMIIKTKLREANLLSRALIELFCYQNDMLLMKILHRHAKALHANYRLTRCVLHLISFNYTFIDINSKTLRGFM